MHVLEGTFSHVAAQIISKAELAPLEGKPIHLFGENLHLLFFCYFLFFVFILQMHIQKLLKNALRIFFSLEVFPSIFI